jgi:hypothetical protein
MNFCRQLHGLRNFRPHSLCHPRNSGVFWWLAIALIGGEKFALQGKKS